MMLRKRNIRDSDRIIARFESELKAGKNPSVKAYNRHYHGLADRTLNALVVRRALADYKEEVKLPEGFSGRQEKLLQGLIGKNEPGRSVTAQDKSSRLK